MIIGIDPGKANLNAYNGSQEFTCLSTMGENMDKLATGYQLEVEGRTYLIGDETLGYDLEESKEKTLHKNLMYLALFYLVPNNSSCTVVVGCPIDVFLNKESNKSYRNFLLSNRYPRITVNGEVKQIYIDNVVVMPESSGVTFRDKEKFKNSVVGVIDIGGSTINHSVFQNQNINRELSFTTRNGMHYLRAEIKRIIKRKLGKHVSEQEIHYFMEHGATIEINNIIDNVVEQYFRALKKDLLQNKWSDEMRLVFTGGGSKQLQQYINQYFQNPTISNDPLYDNSKGYYIVGEMLCDYKK